MQNEENASEWPPESLDWVLENLSRLNDTDDSQNANGANFFKCSYFKRPQRYGHIVNSDKFSKSFIGTIFDSHFRN